MLITACSLFPILGGTGALAGGTTDQKERGEWVSGVDFLRDSRTLFSGITIALKGDMDNGVAVRFFGSRDHWDLDPGNGVSWGGETLLGYMFTRNHLEGEIFVGVDWQNVRLRPNDPTAKVRGTETGAIVEAEIGTDRELPYYFNLAGEYSTAFNSYWVSLKLGLTRRQITFGPQFTVLGDEEDRLKRLGGFVTFDLNLGRSIEVTMSGGYQWSENSSDSSTTIPTGRFGGDGPYGNFKITAPF